MKSSKTLFFVFEALCCYAAVYYSNFIFFYMTEKFGFKALENLVIAALSGLLYTVSSWRGGVFAQKYGFDKSLYFGVIGIMFSMLLGLFSPTVIGQVFAFAFWSVAICFIWPALEGVISKDEDVNLAKYIGLYNTIWAGSAALAYFTAGILLERLGMQSIFWLPLCLLVCLLLLLKYSASLPQLHLQNKSQEPKIINTNTSSHAKEFLHMAWLANPLSYVAINTLIPLIPSIALKLGFSKAIAGIVCSLWMFSRLTAFLILWFWVGWHYRFRWLIGAFVGMVVGFIAIIITHSMVILFLSQCIFGLSIGLIYYSSLYYSMNITEEKGAHGGLHEAMIGAGLFLGPSCGALALVFLPKVINGNVWSVGGILLCGFFTLLCMKISNIRTIKHPIPVCRNKGNTYK